MAAGATYTPLSTTTLGSAAANVNFSSISGSYTDLIIIVYINGFSSTAECGLQFNGDTGTNYSRTYMVGDSVSVRSARTSNATNVTVSANTTNKEQFSAHIMNYSNATTYKTVLSRSDEGGSSTKATVGMWRNTNAITSILIVPTSAVDFPVGSTFTLWGIFNA